MKSHLLNAIKTFAVEEGFDEFAVATVPHCLAYEKEFRDWLGRGFHGQMTYLAENVEMRFNPELLLEGARSVICLAVSHAPPRQDGRNDNRMSIYARGRDYHKVLKARCHRLMDRISLIVPAFAGKACVDSVPISERSFAAAAGLGWIGRNGCLVSPRLGSRMFLCEIVCNLSLPAGEPLANACGSCRRCVEACAMGACAGDGKIDARRCRSYLTIEHDGTIDPKLREQMGDAVFGCDLCQQACPYNQDLPPGDPEFYPRREMPSYREMLCWSDEQWDEFTQSTAMRRIGIEGFFRNVIIAAANSSDKSLAAPLKSIGQSRPLFAPLADWAVTRLNS